MRDDWLSFFKQNNFSHAFRNFFLHQTFPKTAFKKLSSFAEVIYLRSFLPQTCSILIIIYCFPPQLTVSNLMTSGSGCSSQYIPLMSGRVPLATRVQEASSPVPSLETYTSKSSVPLWLNKKAPKLKGFYGFFVVFFILPVVVVPVLGVDEGDLKAEKWKKFNTHIISPISFTFLFSPGWPPGCRSPAQSRWRRRGR